MKRIFKQVCIILVWLMTQELAFSQEAGNRNIGVKLIAKHTIDEVWLRWAPTDALGWEGGNQHGWWLQRVLLPLDDAPGDSIYTMLVKEPLKPLPIEFWEHPSDTSDAAAIAAQMLYGETLDISAPVDAMVYLDKFRELQTRFSFALSAAEQDFDVAVMMGLGFVDTDVLPGRTYIYRLFAHTPLSDAVSDTAGVVVNLRQAYELPVAFGLEAQVRDTVVDLKWPAGYHKGIYSAYSLEVKVADGEFRKLSSLPLVQLTDEGESDFMNYYRYIHPQDGDSLAFRVRGITPFGDMGPPSEEVTVWIPVDFPAPHNLSYQELQSETLGLQWEFPADYEYKLKSFEVASSTSLSGQPVILGSFTPEKRAAVIPVSQSEFYLSIRAIGHDGSIKSDYPILVQLDDSIPPAPPVHLQGHIDQSGQVMVNWSRGHEPDLMGYRVYASTRPEAEFILVSPDYVSDTVFAWQQPLNTLSAYLYVSVMANDFRYNFSGFSDTLRLAIPDTIPPSAPVMTRCSYENGNLNFGWIPSSSPDVKHHLVMYAQWGEDAQPQNIATIDDPGLRHYVWQQPAVGHWDFFIVAVDHSGNSSKSQQQFNLRIEKNPFDQLVPELTARANHPQGHILLQWQVPPEGAKTIIYKSINDNDYRIIQTSSRNSFRDTDVRVGEKYNYMIAFVKEQGQLSGYSKIDVVIF